MTRSTISFARRSSAFSFNSLTLSDSSVVTPARTPVWTSERRTHLRSVSGEPIPNFEAIDLIAKNSEGQSALVSTTIRTARSRNSCG